jgi:hypothetical protein
MEDAFPRGLYRLPDQQADPAQAWLGAFAVALILIVLAQWLATEYVAQRFAFRAALGTPLLPYVYPPLDGLGWALRFRTVSDPRVHQTTDDHPHLRKKHRQNFEESNSAPVSRSDSRRASSRIHRRKSRYPSRSDGRRLLARVVTTNVSARISPDASRPRHGN